MKKYLFFIGSLVTLISFAFIFGFQQIIYFRSQADVSQASFSVDNSYLFVSPLKASVTQKKKSGWRSLFSIIRVWCFREAGGLSFDQNLSVENVQSISDNHGKAYFDVSASNAVSIILMWRLTVKV